MPTPTPDKIIVSNCERLKEKYGAAGAAKVLAAVKKLITADARRGLATIFVDLSDSATMSGYGASAVPAASAGNAKLNKVAIDKVYSYATPHPSYLTLLGSVDVIPHVPLANPAAGDGDSDLPSDLPYACDKPYSTDAQDFIAPTRVVGRLPNVTNDTDPKYLIGLLNTAATYTNNLPEKYGDFLGITAKVWQTSSELSLDAVFGTHSGIKISPPDGYKWTAAEAKRLSHFINCHGASADPHFYGQKGATYPVAHDAKWMSSKVAKGTVMAAECCYGAELYDPALPTAAGQIAICNTYLARKAYAVFASTNIAYGPSDSNDNADLMCQYFLQQIVAGASAGRACLQARLDYVAAKGGVLTHIDLKTVGQFNLLADSSLTPVKLPHPHALAVPMGKTTKALAEQKSADHARMRRRVGLVAQASGIAAYRLFESKSARRGNKSIAFGKLRKAASELGVRSPDVILSSEVGDVSDGARAKTFLQAAAAGPVPIAVHTLLERRKAPRELPHLPSVAGVEAIEYDDGMEVRAFQSR